MSSRTETGSPTSESEAVEGAGADAATVLVLHPDKDEAARLVEAFKGAGMRAHSLGNSSAAAAFIYSEPPDVVIYDLSEGAGQTRLTHVNDDVLAGNGERIVPNRDGEPLHDEGCEHDERPEIDAGVAALAKRLVDHDAEDLWEG